jgi:hypothetical protein
VGRVLLDLEACQSPVTIAGEGPRARSVVAAMAVEAATSPWCREADLTLVGFPELAALASPRVHLASTVDEAWHHLGPRLQEARAAMTAQPGRTAPEVRAQADREQASTVRPRVLLCGVPLSVQERALLSPWFLPAPGRAPLAVVSVAPPATRPAMAGPASDPPWTFRLDHRGVLTSPSFGHPVGAQALAPATVARLADLVGHASAGLVTTGSHTARVPSRADADPDVRVVVHLLGTPSASGDVGPGSPVVVEVAAFVALRGHCRVDELLAALWPDGNGDRHCRQAVRRTQWWLGLDAEGRPRLDVQGDVLSMSPEVQTDWDLLLAHDSGARPLDDATITRLLRGAPVNSVTAGRYAWLAREPITHVIPATVVDVCVHTATRAVARGDTRGATELALGGLLVDPAARPLWSLVDDTVPVPSAADGPGRSPVGAWL